MAMQSSDTQHKPLWRELQDLVAPKRMKDFAHSNSMHEWRCAFVIFLARKPVAVTLLLHSDLMSIKLRWTNWLNRALDKSQSWKKYLTQWVTVLKTIWALQLNQDSCATVQHFFLPRISSRHVSSHPQLWKIVEGRCLCDRGLARVMLPKESKIVRLCCGANYANYATANSSDRLASALNL